MIVIGIKRARGVELIDAAYENGEIVPSQCPGDLRISCNVCSHAWTEGSTTTRKKSRQGKEFPFTVCHWFDAHPSSPNASGPAD